MKYERLTDKKIDLDKLSEKAKSRISNTYLEYAKMNNALWELENKIENGTLIEMPRIIHPNKAEWYVQYQYPSGVIQYDICFSQAEAEKKLKEKIQNET